MRFRQWVREHLVTADAVYGLILYSALIGGVSDENSPATEVLFVSASSLLVFWGAHVFSRTIATHRVKDGTEMTLGDACRRAFRESSGMLYAATLPSLPLIAGSFRLLTTDDAVSLSLLIAMLALGVLGYRAFAQRGSRVVTCVFGALGTAFFGFLVIVLKVIAH